MDNLLLYLLKVAAGTILFYLCYLLLFSKDTFYTRNRIFLILTLLLPTILPTLKIKTLSYSVLPVEPVNAIDSMIFSGNSLETVMSGTINYNSFDFNRLFVGIYCAITGFLLLRVVISLVSTHRIIKKGIVKKSQFPKVVISDKQLPPFSFFPYAVIPVEDYESGNYTDILDHEFAHLRQGHTFDLLLSELSIAFQWFNPFVWLIKRSVILNHEYLADHISLSTNKSVLEYQYRLLNFQTCLKHISLAHNFNSLLKNRIIMINKNPTQKYAMLKNILILPLVAIIVYAFATPEYQYVTPESDPLAIYLAPAIIQKEVKGIVLDVEGKPLKGVNITSTGTMGNAFGATTGDDGRFSIKIGQDNASLLFFCRGYKQLTLNPDLNEEMRVKMEKDPEYKAPSGSITDFASVQRPVPIVVIDGVISDKNYNDARIDLGYDMGIVNMIRGKEATDKYGEKGVNGVYEITTRKKAIALGLNPPFPRLAPEDYPTFQGETRFSFSDWVANQVKYPAEAQANKLEGWVSVNFTVELNGSISNVVSTIPVNKLLSDEVIRVVQSSPKWDPPKNPNVDEPITSGITLKFKLPDQILAEPPFVVVEQMPSYPGGDKELLNFIKNNTRYPEEAKSEKIQGRVILRFVVSAEGNTEAVSVIKGVHPLLDTEAIRVVGMLTGWKPGMQGGKAVNVWYMAPVTFSLSEPEPPK
jgi:TonB family protein